MKVSFFFLLLCSIAHGTTIVSDLTDAAQPWHTTYRVDTSLSYFQPMTTTVLFSVTNTTQPVIGGFLTGLAFNSPSSIIADSLTLPVNWSLLSGNINTSPFPDTRYAFVIGNSWQGGGSPSNGIAPGQTFHFVFTLNDIISESQFENFYNRSQQNWLSVLPYNMIARFRGLNEGGSNKVPGFTEVVPEPSAIALMVIGLVLMGVRRYISISYPSHS